MFGFHQLKKGFADALQLGTYRTSSWLFIRGMGLIYLAAFASLWVQVIPLYGKDGLLPFSEVITALHNRYTPFQQLTQFPSLFFFGSSDAAVNTGCALGLLSALCILLNYCPRYALLVCWLMYLSFVSLGRDFMSFQWDTLLLEVGFLSIFLAPGHFWKGFKHRVHPRMVFLLLIWWLNFRFHLQSGFAKLMSGDETWRNLTALTYYYQTAPLPTWIGWMMNKLPVWFHKASALLVFLLEMIIPYFFFSRRRFRHAAALLLVGFQIIILISANYTFFNHLTILLCLSLLDDQFFDRWFTLPQPSDVELKSKRLNHLNLLKRYASYFVALLLGSFSLISSLHAYGLANSIRAFNRLEPFRISNNYGLFAVMTKQRWELQIELSSDQTHWRTYPFRYKPSSENSFPRFAAPYQPRLDFQCWFLSFDGNGDFQAHPYLLRLIAGIFKDDEKIMGLLGPCPMHKPKFIRLRMNRFEMTSLTEFWRTGNYWRTVESKPWSPIMQYAGN